MPAITYQDFAGGIDRRLPISVQEASRLWELKNAYITAGKRIKKRPGLRPVTSGLDGSFGLENLDGGLCVFYETGTGFVSPSADIGTFELESYSTGGTTELVDVLYAKMFQGFPYVVAVHYTESPRVALPGHPPLPPIIRRSPRHHYCDVPATLVTDSNCPHEASVTVAASRVFGTGGQVVRYTAAGDARDWTTASDAGFLSTSLQQDTKEPCSAVGTFDDALVVLFPEGIQVWDVATDPTANNLRRRTFGLGTKHPLSLSAFYRDLSFASPYGVRSLSVQVNVDRPDENDIGVAVDALTVPAQETHEANSTEYVKGVWVQQLGQYWLMYDAGGYTRVFAYAFSRSSKLAAWSEYTFPVLLTAVTTVAGKVYARTDTTLYEVTDDQYTDDGTSIAVEAQMSFQDAKTPGVLKQFYGADFVIEGSAEVSYKYDTRDLAKETIAETLSGDTRPGDMTPMEVCSTSIAPVFRHEADEAFELSAVTLYYNNLGANA